MSSTSRPRIDIYGLGLQGQLIESLRMNVGAGRHSRQVKGGEQLVAGRWHLEANDVQRLWQPHQTENFLEKRLGYGFPFFLIC